MQITIDHIWTIDDVPQYLNKQISPEVETWLSARLIQSANTQASAIVRGTRKKQEDRLWRINELTKEGKLKEAEKLQEIYDKQTISKPKLNGLIPLQLDGRFVEFIEGPTKLFDGWLVFSSFGERGDKIVIPFKKHQHYNEQDGKLLNGVKLTTKKLILSFRYNKFSNDNQDKLGIDIGLNNVVTTSDNRMSTPDKHGHTLNSIVDKLARKKKGSKAFKRAQSHRKNFINYSINRLNLSDVGEIKIEDVTKLKFGKRNKRRIQHWSYSDIVGKLRLYCEECGVRLSTVNPAFTSQRCSECGWVQKANRNGQCFKCKKCGFTTQADLNAAINISLGLSACPKGQSNKVGFYWRVQDNPPLVESLPYSGR